MCSILAQEDDNGDEHPIAYSSRGLVSSEKNYSVTQKGGPRSYIRLKEVSSLFTTGVLPDRGRSPGAALYVLKIRGHREIRQMVGDNVRI